jgi:hypothetical protein
VRGGEWEVEVRRNSPVAACLFRIMLRVVQNVTSPGMPLALSLFSLFTMTEFRRDMSSSCDMCMSISVSVSSVSVPAGSEEPSISLLENDLFPVGSSAY